MEKDYLRVGVITSPHGIKGEVNVYPTTDEPDRFSQISDLFTEKNGQSEKRTVEGVKFFKGMVILKLSGIDSIDDAEKMRSADLYIHRSQSSPCKEGEYFVCDLLDLDVVDLEGQTVGTVKDVLTTGANPVIVIQKPDGKELLLPKIPVCIREVDLENGKMTVFVMPGLED